MGLPHFPQILDVERLGCLQIWQIIFGSAFPFMGLPHFPQILDVERLGCSQIGQIIFGLFFPFMGPLIRE